MNNNFSHRDIAKFENRLSSTFNIYPGTLGLVQIIYEKGTRKLRPETL